LPSRDEIERGLSRFIGEIEQVPPMFSAVKRSGVPLHRLAREGKEVEREPKKVRIAHIEVLSYQEPQIEFKVDCSQGTYVRTLADDLGRQLGCGAHLSNLRRTRSGPFELAGAMTPESLAEAADRDELEGYLLSPVEVLGLPVVQLGSDESRRVKNGCEIGCKASVAANFVSGGRVAAVEPGGQLLAVMEVLPGRRLKPLRVLQSLAPAG
jgi:tRNA pseudouridine55 synthase